MELFKYLLYGLIVLFVSSLIVFDLDINVRYSNIANLILLGGAFVEIFLTKDSRIFNINVITKSYLFFVIFSFFSIIWAIDGLLAVNYFNRLIIVLLDVIVVYYIISKYNIQSSILLGILLGSIYNYIIAFDILKPNYEIYEAGRFLGSVGNPNKLSRVMILNLFVSLFFLRTSKSTLIKLLLVANIFLTFYVTFLTVSRKGIILIPLVVLLSVNYTRVKGKNLIIYPLLIVITLYVLVKVVPAEITNEFYERNIYRLEGLVSGMSNHGDGDASTNERVALAKGGAQLFSEYPILGVGLNNFRVFFGKYAHNNFIEVAVNTGIIGFFLFYAIYFHLLKNVFQVRDKILRRLLISAIIIILINDFSTVSYYDKLVIMFLLYIYSVSNKKIRVT